MFAKNEISYPIQSDIAKDIRTPFTELTKLVSAHSCAQFDPIVAVLFDYDDSVDYEKINNWSENLYTRQEKEDLLGKNSKKSDYVTEWGRVILGNTNELK